RNERTLVSVVLVDLADPPGRAAAERAPELTALRREAERREGRAEMLDGEVFAATFAGRHVATDQAAIAARSAIALRAITSSRPIALAMGWAEGAGGRLPFEV